jgi:hypothetical protein
MFFILLNKLYPGFGADMIFYFASYYGLFPGLIIFLGIFSLLFIIVRLFFFFLEPVLVHKNESYGFKGILKSVLKYANKHPFHLLRTWFTVFVITNGIPFIIDYVVDYIYIENDWTLAGILILCVIVYHLIDLVLKIFIFNSYFHKIRS